MPGKKVEQLTLVEPMPTDEDILTDRYAAVRDGLGEWTPVPLSITRTILLWQWTARVVGRGITNLREIENFTADEIYKLFGALDEDAVKTLWHIITGKSSKWLDTHWDMNMAVQSLMMWFVTEQVGEAVASAGMMVQSLPKLPSRQANGASTAASDD